VLLYYPSEETRHGARPMLTPKEEPMMTALLIASAIALIVFASRRAALRLRERPIPVRRAMRRYR